MTWGQKLKSCCLMAAGLVPFAAMVNSWGLLWLQFELWLEWVGTSQDRLFLSLVYWLVLLIATFIWWGVQIFYWIFEKQHCVISGLVLTILWLPASGILWVVSILAIMWLAFWAAAFNQGE